MKYDPAKHHRRSIRLKGYDYTQPGWYFVTICVQNRECLLGEIRDGVMHHNEFGNIVAECWQWLAEQYPYVDLDECVVMPNHFHGILGITDKIPTVDELDGDDRRRGGSRTAPTMGTPDNPMMVKRKPLGRLIGAFETVSTKKINQIRGTQGAKLWQRDFWDHIIRNETELNRIRQYIRHNPMNWQSDSLFTK